MNNETKQNTHFEGVGLVTNDLHYFIKKKNIIQITGTIKELFICNDLIIINV